MKQRRGKNVEVSGTKKAASETGSVSAPPEAGVFERAVRSRLETLAYLPTAAAVAVRFVDLSKNPDADPADYVKVISSDSSLSGKLLSLANSSWFGVRNRVTRIPVAVNLLGLGAMRTLAISYCVTGLHSELRLKPDESRMFWEASLCKAVAARTYAALFDAKLAEEAFAAALFQDFALPVMFACARDEMRALLGDKTLDWRTRLARERELFRLDHAELGRSLAQKLDLPDLYVDAIAFHHNAAALGEFVDRPELIDALHVASLFPHMLEAWNRADAGELRAFLGGKAAATRLTAEEFLETVQREFETLYGYFEQGRAPAAKLREMLERATAEAADNTTRLVATVHELMQQAANQGREINLLMSQQDQAEEAAARDALTGAFNRGGFIARARDLLGKALRYGSSFAIAYLDVDNFKEINDTCGHAVGDKALQRLVEVLQQVLRQSDMVGRVGGDEFVVLLRDCSQADAVSVIERAIAAIAGQRIVAGGLKPTISGGLVWGQIRGAPAGVGLDKLMAAADELMYEAKRAGGNRLRWRAITDPEASAKSVA